MKNLYYCKKRLKKYKNDEKIYEFDKKLRILFLDFLEVVELNFRKNFFISLQNNDINIFDRKYYKEKYIKKIEKFSKNKKEYFENKKINYLKND
jgi:abortive infection bacteriophage resistance protein